METASPIILQVIFYLAIGAAIYSWFKWDFFMKDNKQYLFSFISYQIGIFLIAIAVYFIEAWFKLDMILIGSFLIGLALLVGGTIYLRKKLKHEGM
ncbi:hypothetical protein ACWE42_06210 [Sutcliffiella cohnii]|uniref:hypothetical protein n=1 Tax=Sutcliffiella cohnii TaxID=33932 RepID=UPI002E20BF02|nr:hypothetical protein [Sutcliffiella cohnii]